MEVPTIRDSCLGVPRRRTPSVWVDVEVPPVYRDSRIRGTPGLLPCVPSRPNVSEVYGVMG